jgi:hypothetical protein
MRSRRPTRSLVSAAWAAAAAVIALSTSACVSLQSVSLTQIPAQRSNRIHAESSKFMFLYISFSNDYVDDVRDELKSKCRDGKVTGILTKDESVTYFPILFTSRRIEAQGFCVK